MYSRNKYHVTRVVQFASFFGALIGIGKIISSLNLSGPLSMGTLIIGAVILFSSVIIGVTASVLGSYYKSREDESPVRGVDVETLAKFSDAQKAEHQALAEAQKAKPRTQDGK